jgi:hypothetical protein
MISAVSAFTTGTKSGWYENDADGQAAKKGACESWDSLPPPILKAIRSRPMMVANDVTITGLIVKTYT